MWIEVGNVMSRLSRYEPLERTWLQEYLTFTTKVNRKGGGVLRKETRMFNVLTDTFPSGWVPIVRKAAEREGFQVQLLDHRIAPALPDPQADIEWLYDYQEAAVDAVERSHHGILWVPTGGGKTEIACGLAKRLNCPWLFLVHRKSLLNQTAARFLARCGEQAGTIGEGRWQPSEWFTVATFQTLVRALKDKRSRARAKALLEQAGGLIVDECHVLPADSFWKVAMLAKNAYYRVGLSGTPLARGDRKSTQAIAALGPVLYRIKAETLVDRGRLAKPTIRMVEVVQEVEAPTWQGVEGLAIVRSPLRNRVLTNIAKKAAKPALCFVKQLKHGHRLKQRFEKAGLKVEFAQGKHSVVWRENLVRSLERGDIDVLICTVIFQEGIDIPSLASVINAAGMKSIIAALQRLGRGLRTDQGKKMTVEVWDIHDKGNKHLEKHTRTRVKAYASEGYQTHVVGSP